tara:strand:+ start:91 stop:348 length:258 start_codon:yes stop_codon:yes gene_type:complete
MPLQDITEMENMLDEVTDGFQDLLKQLFTEDPGLFETQFANGEVKVHSTQASWNAQVSCAADELREELNRVIEQFEIRTLQGEFA